MKLVYGVRPIPVGVLIVLEVLKAVCATHIEYHTVVIQLTFILIIISIPSPPHSFIAGLNPSFLQIIPTVAFLFFSETDSTDSLDCLPILLSMPVFLFSFFSVFPLFSCRFRAVD